MFVRRMNYSLKTRFIIGVFVSLFIFSVETISAQTQSYLNTNNSVSVRGLKDILYVLDGLSILRKDGTQVRLHQIDIPDHFRQDPGPISGHAKGRLGEILQDQKIREYIPIKNASQIQNRLGQDVLHIENLDGEWVQEVLISEGLARVIPDQKLEDITIHLLKVEYQARKEKKGLWEDSAYKIHSAETIKPSAWEMQIVEDKIKKIATIKNNTYLNFGDNWRTDFTILIPSKIRQYYTKKGIDIFSFQDQKIQVRGYVEDFNGPLIKLESPSHLIFPDRIFPETSPSE